MISILMRDGRKLAYAEYGDPQGKPVLFFHGTPGSRFFRPSDQITASLGVRLICVDRPGFGGSTFQPGRRIPDWPMDVLQLVGSLGIDKFAVAGHSGGGPYTLACAGALPDHITSAAVLSGAGPINAPGISRGMTTVNKLGVTMGRLIPWALWQVLIWGFYHRRSDDPASYIDRGSRHRPQADEELVRTSEVREVCIQSEVEAFRPSLKGLAWDTRLLTRPWDVRLEDILIPVYLWHGTDDDQATISMARYMAARITTSKLKVCEKEAHLLLFPHWGEILAQLLSE